jgi:serine/threonine protein kinase/Tol biopolymer transport system component
MGTPRRELLSRLYHAASECPPEERSAFLKNACAGDAALQRELESLLRHEPAAARFLDIPAAEIMANAHPPDPAMVGRQLGPYKIAALLGAGGMGEVYRARDTKLGRDVAIKILPVGFTADPERQARFAREARLLATLNHPHIGAIYGLEESDGVAALVLEFVDGPTLADRLKHGPLPIAEALAIARQIAEALEAAHEKGIVHRDLKPANIVLQRAANASGVPSSDVRAKVLDFGLAKTMTVGVPGDLTQRASGSLDGTAEGRILGTPAYMSPEQARGQAVDKRTDIWAFGCVLFEMLAVRPAFQGDTISDTLVSILEREPDWAALPANTPDSIRTLLHRCLRKDPQKRLHDVADARIELDEIDPPLRSSANARDLWPGNLQRLGWITAALLAVALLGAVSVAVVLVRRSQPAADSVEFSVGPPENASFTADGAPPHFTVAPDGRHVAFVAYSQGVSMLWVRPIARPQWRRLAGTEGAAAPFWSPDSESIGFFADNQLKTIRLVGGSPQRLCEATLAQWSTGAWNRRGVIVFGGLGALLMVRSTGGTPTPVTTLVKSETAHRWPAFLPDDDHFLYLAQRAGANELRVGSLTSTETASLGPFESNAVYAQEHLLFVRAGSLMAQSFDRTTRQLKGDPFVLAEQTGVVPPNQRGLFSVSATGVLAYTRMGRLLAQLTWMDREGNTLDTAGDPGFFANLDLSPNDLHVAVSELREQPGGQSNVDIYLIDLTRAGTSSRLTDHARREFDPAWSPNGLYIAFNSDRADASRYSLYVRQANRSGEDDLLVKTQTSITAPAWSPKGDVIVYGEWAAASGSDFDLWTVALAGDRKPSVFLKTPYDEASGAFSPDGKWIAYHSNESGRSEVYVRPFPKQEGQFLISRNGGRAPRWRADGKELFFLAADGTLMAAGIDTTTAFAATVPHMLFRTGLTEAGNFHPYAVAKDGQRFLIPVRREAPGSTPITVVLNWPATLPK